MTSGKLKAYKSNFDYLNMADKRFYSDVRFVRAENLKGRAKEAAEAADIKEGLAILRVSVNSPPQYVIEKVTGDPLAKLKEIGASEGITQEKMNKALEEAFNSK